MIDHDENAAPPIYPMPKSNEGNTQILLQTMQVFKIGSSTANITGMSVDNTRNACKEKQTTETTARPATCQSQYCC